MDETITPQTLYPKPRVKHKQQAAARIHTSQASLTEGNCYVDGTREASNRTEYAVIQVEHECRYEVGRYKDPKSAASRANKLRAQLGHDSDCEITVIEVRPGSPTILALYASEELVEEIYGYGWGYGNGY